MGMTEKSRLINRNFILKSLTEGEKWKKEGRKILKDTKAKKSLGKRHIYICVMWTCYNKFNDLY